MIIVWLVAGAGLIAMSLHMGSPGIVTYSGTVTIVHAESGDGLRIMLQGLPSDFFFSDLSYSPLPDVRVADDVQILAEAKQFGVNDQSGAPVVSGLAIQSARGAWTDSIFGDAVAPFTPDTWPLHEAIRWLLFALGSAGAALGLASLFRWIPSKSAAGARVTAVETEAPDAIDGDWVASVAEPGTSILAPDHADSAVAAAVDPPADAVIPQSPTAITVGWLSVGISVISDLIAIATGGANRCGSAPGWTFLVLLLVPVLLAAGGITVLVLASRAAKYSGSAQTGARAIGVLALALAVVSVPLNLIAVASWSFCF